jgi:hypothetical protein
MQTATIKATGDTNIRSTDQYSTEFYTNNFMPIGRMSGSQLDRILLAFDFSPVSNTIIDSAALYLYQDYSENAYSNTLAFYARCITGAWSESTVTYANQPAVSTIAQAELTLTGNANGPRSFDITELVKDIVENDRVCHGIMLMQANESLSERRKQFFTKERGESYRPYILVSYRMPVWIASGKEAISKAMLSMKIAPTISGAFKNVIGMKIVAAKGGPFKTVF